MFKFASVVLLWSLCIGVLADSGGECDFHQYTCGVGYLYEFIIVGVSSNHTGPQECQKARETLTCYAVLTQKCDSPAKDEDLRKLENVGRVIDYLCEPSNSSSLAALSECVSDLNHCYEEMSAFMEPAFLPEGQNLEHNCPIVKSVASCMIREIRSCFSPQQDIFNLKMIDELITSVCDEDSPLGKLYRENVGCINGMQDDIVAILKEVNEDVHAFAEYLEEKDVPATTIGRVSLCLEHGFAIARIAFVIQERCSQEIGEELRKNIGHICLSKYMEDEVTESFYHYLNFKMVPSSERDIIMNSID